MIELLVAIAIISILAALLVGVAATAGRTAREARTKSFVTRLHTLLIERYDLYRTRRVELNQRDIRPTGGNGVEDWLDELLVANPTGFSASTGIWTGNLDEQQGLAAGRLSGLRELMKLEMPDRWSDILGGELPTSLSPIDFSVRPSFLFLNEAPTLWFTYAREYNRLVASGATRDELLENQGAECLYLTIIYATGDGEARGLFKETDIGDTDGDGALEFLDGWGNPISYLRWAPGFESDAQASFASIADVFADAERESGGERGVDAVRILLTEDHDPLDLFRVDWANVDSYSPPGNQRGPRGWRLTPLVVSPGADEELGIRVREEAYWARANPYVLDTNDPANVASTDFDPLGALTDTETYADNIHSHDIGSFTRAR